MPPTTGATAVQQRVHALDGLRALAATLVVGHHLGATPLSKSLIAKGHTVVGFFVGSVGSSGVELFFVLSAVVLSRPYLRYGRSFDALTYVRRRVQRLYPPYAVAWLLAGPSTYAVSHFSTWFSATAQLPPFRLRSWLLQAGILYFGPHYNVAWWSLGVEVLFYILLPFLIPLFLRIRGIALSLALLSSSAVLSLLVPRLMPVLFAAIPNELGQLLIYFPCFIAGLIIARMDLPRAVGVCLATSGVALLFLASQYPLFLFSHVGYGLLYMGIVSRAMDSGSGLSSALSAWRLVWLGERSYSLFLTHASVIILVYQVASTFIAPGARFIVVTRVLVVPLSLLAAMLLFSRVESPFAHGLVTSGSFWPWRSAAETPPPGAAVSTGRT